MPDAATGRATPAALLAFHADAYAPGARHRSHAHDELHFSVVLAGRVTERVGNATEWAGPLSVVAKDPGVVHADDFGPSGARLARLTLTSTTLGELLGTPGRSPGWRWTHDPLVAEPFLRLVRRASGQAMSVAATDPDVVDLLAAFIARPASGVRGNPPQWLTNVIRDAREAWHPDRSVATLAGDAGVHPVYLARCVRRWFGTTLGAELRRQRLRAAVAAIAETTRTISDVAHSMGFADEPHLNRDCRAMIGLTPGRYRQLLAQQTYRCRDVG